MNEQQLISKAQQGATDCFTQLVACYQARLYSYLLARCQNSYDADDVLQETFFSAYKYLKTYDAQWQFSTWLFTIARRILSNLKTIYHVAIDAISGHECVSEIDPYVLDRNNIWNIIKQDLSPNCYDVLWFFYMEQASIKEIAHIMNQSESWVKTNLHRSKMKLSNNSALELMLAKE
ncbi:RNA polymerase sigma factor [Marinicella litoralis]|uniref:RNA polymerase sigma factor (Sigma-70 family) n=1 Tax=Marinicella litoralis TaxID=644220 RepID=A0A4R6XZV5_9GAMM|nr:sigma-70 family RNA polymerase sigma factor [Marinicella litoralis]TDR23884.1 RNA polymerase sigma factor (sigma-70 family) [Marinicella litoralis]